MDRRSEQADLLRHLGERFGHDGGELDRRSERERAKCELDRRSEPRRVPMCNLAQSVRPC